MAMRDRTRSRSLEGRRDRVRAKAREKPTRFFDPRCLPSPGAAGALPTLARLHRPASFVDRVALT